MPFNGPEGVTAGAGVATAPEFDKELDEALTRAEAELFAEQLAAGAVAAFVEAGYSNVTAVNAQNQRREVVSSRDGNVSTEAYMAVDTDEERSISKGTCRGDYRVDDASQWSDALKTAAGALAMSKPTQTVPHPYSEWFIG